MVSQVSSATAAQHTAATNEPTQARRYAPSYYRRNEDLDADMLDLSYKKKDDDEKGFIKSTVDTIGKAAKSFVDITVNAFARASADAVVDKAIGKIAGK